MIGMMDHIDKQYGGVFEYLDSIGFDEMEKRIKSISAYWSFFAYYYVNMNTLVYIKYLLNYK